MTNDPASIVRAKVVEIVTKNCETVLPSRIEQILEGKL